MAQWSKILEGALGQLDSGWTIDQRPAPRRLDGAFTLHTPAGGAVDFVVEEANRFSPSDVYRIAERLCVADGVPMLVAPYLSPASRSALRARRIAHADATGTLWIGNADLYVDRAGADRPPLLDEQKRSRRTLKGPITGRVVRLLCEHRESLRVTDVAKLSNVNPGNVTRILELLEREQLAERTGEGRNARFCVNDVYALIQRWATDLAKDREAHEFLAPRGLGYVRRTLEDADGVAPLVTGAYASNALAPVADAASIDLYVHDPDDLTADLSLVRTDGPANVRLIRAYDRIVWENSIAIPGQRLRAVNPVQIGADLITLPHRSRDEVDALFAWMGKNEARWRRE